MDKTIFFRRETYAARCQRQVGSSGRRRHDASSIIQEAFREPGYAPHVAAPLIMTLVPSGPRTARAVLESVRRHVELIRITDTVGRRRPLHPATHILCSDVVSTPVEVAVTEQDPTLRSRVVTYLQAALEWTRADIEARGGKIVQAIIHLDETRWHMHVLSIAACGQAKRLHPGHAAKTRRKAELAGSGATPGEINALADEAYRMAVRDHLNDFHAHVGHHLSLARRSDTPTASLPYVQMKRQTEFQRREAQRAMDQLAEEAEQAAARNAAVAAQGAAEMHALERERAALARRRAELEIKEDDLYGRESLLSDERREHKAALRDLEEARTGLEAAHVAPDAHVDGLTRVLARSADQLTEPSRRRVRKRLDDTGAEILIHVDEVIAAWLRSVASEVSDSWAAPDADRRLQAVLSGGTLWAAHLIGQHAQRLHSQRSRPPGSPLTRPSATPSARAEAAWTDVAP